MKKSFNFILMGHCAGGHLALLYAYKNPTQIDLVISEAGPTNFLEHDEQGNLILPDEKACTMAGVMYDDSEDVKEGKLRDASPCAYANSSGSLYTIYARGNNDIIVQVDQPIALVRKLLPSYTNVADSAIEPYLQNNFLTNETNCAFFSFANCGHESFDNTIKPTSTNTVVGDYYQKIEGKLKNLL